MAVLSFKLRQEGVKTLDDSPARWVLLQKAREYAIQSGDLNLALGIIEDLNSYYRIDDVQVRLETLERLAEASDLSTYQRNFSLACVDSVERAIAIDAFDAAEKFISMAPGTARRTNDAKYERAVTDRTNDVASMMRLAAELTEWREELEQAPADPEANERVGLYECLVKEEWKIGLLKLLLCDDPSLSELAAGDLADPARSVDQVQLADDGWTYAETRKGTMRTSAQRRAAHWYRKALGGLRGASRRKAVRRLEELESGAPKRERILFTSEAVLDRFVLGRRHLRNGVRDWEPADQSEFWQVADHQLLATSTDELDTVHSIVRNAYRSISYVRVLGRIVPAHGEEVRITVGPVHVKFNCRDTQENRLSMKGKPAASTTPYRLTPGMIHWIEFRQAGENAQVLVDGKQEFAVAAKLEGIVDVGAGSNTIAAIREILIVGDVDYSREAAADDLVD
jgi:hypothetical protein